MQITNAVLKCPEMVPGKTQVTNFRDNNRNAAFLMFICRGILLVNSCKKKISENINMSCLNPTYYIPYNI